MRSRSFDFEIEGTQKETMVPLMDMLNHSEKEVNAKYKFCNSREGVILSASEDVDEGQELFISYGNKK